MGRYQATDWSSGHYVLLQLAESLFIKSGSIKLADGLETWGDELFQVAMHAIYFQRQGKKSGWLKEKRTVRLPHMIRKNSLLCRVIAPAANKMLQQGLHKTALLMLVNKPV